MALAKSFYLLFDIALKLKKSVYYHNLYSWESDNYVESKVEKSHESMYKTADTKN